MIEGVWCAVVTVGLGGKTKPQVGFLTLLETNLSAQCNAIHFGSISAGRENGRFVSLFLLLQTLPGPRN